MLPGACVCDKVIRSLIRELHFDISRTRAQLPLAGGVALRGDVAAAGSRFHRAFRSLDFDGARTAATSTSPGAVCSNRTSPLPLDPVKPPAMPMA